MFSWAAPAASGRGFAPFVSIRKYWRCSRRNKPSSALSGGQAQRLALARTLAGRRPVYILDDPFSALDKETEQEIFRNIQSLCRDSIVILISHRLYCFDRTTKVIWLSGNAAQGSSALIGANAALRKKCEDYDRLWRLQEGETDHEQQ